MHRPGRFSALTLVRAGVATAPLALAMMAAPATAQDSTAQAAPPASASASQEPPSSTQDVVVTGSLIRNRSAESASPLVSLGSEDLEKRGINTVADALQQLSANNAGTVPPSWSAFGFATGASTPSLRGFNDAFTLTLFDGLRSAPYPLADDGYRNFVDINTIPDSIVDRVDVLQDGASSIYGSDAVAGVINVLVKKQITGVHLNASAGISEQGDAGERRIDATYGYGKLREDGFNFYVNAEYQQNDALFLRDRGYPYNSSDQSGVCGKDATGARVCGSNNVRNGIQYDGSYLGFTSTTTPYVAPYSASGGAALGQYRQLNPASGCNGLPSVTLNAGQIAASDTALGATLTPSTVCQSDTTNRFYMYNSPIQRVGGTARGTVDITPSIQAYGMFNYYRVKTYSQTSPESFASGSTTTAPVGTEDTVPVFRIYLPVYVCPQGTGTVNLANGRAFSTGCSAANGTINPNNPFAGPGTANSLARLLGQYDRPRSTNTEAQTFRFAGGVSGSLGSGFTFNVEGTHSWLSLDVIQRNYLNARGLINAVAQGTYNFLNPALNTEAQRELIAPTSRTHSISRVTQFQGTLQKDITQLGGGALTAAVGLGWRKESIRTPSANPSNPADPVNRYYTINSVSTNGSRSIFSAFGEIDAPLLSVLRVNASGRYDKYSLDYSNRGFAYFAPKVEVQFTPIRQVKFRGTYSKGFAVPSISEATATSTGYVTTVINCARYSAFCNAHASNPGYYQGLQGIGITSIANPNLQPQKSRSFTGGVVIQPTRNITLTADYWNTKIDNYIVSLNAQALDQYYLNNGNVTLPGVTVIPNAPDDANPAALPSVSIVQNPYANAASLLGSGVDLSASLRLPVTQGLRLTSTATASYLDKLQLTDAAGSVQPWAGTLSPCNVTSCSGAPRWRAVWANTLDLNNKYSLTATTYFTSGYTLEATDLGGIKGNCLASIGANVVTYADGATPIRCSTRGVFDVDLNATVKVQNNFTFYVNVINLLNLSPPYDPSAGYSIYNFNPAWADKNFIGRYFRIGAKVDF